MIGNGNNESAATIRFETRTSSDMSNGRRYPSDFDESDVDKDEDCAVTDVIVVHDDDDTVPGKFLASIMLRVIR
jgi:hypothetical protein